MFKPDFKEFEKLTAAGYLVPVYKEYLMDMDSPVSVLSRFVEDEEVFLLESVEGGERRGRYSFLGIEPYARFTVEKGVPYLTENGRRRALAIPPNGPLTALRGLVLKQKVFEFPELPKFIGGAVGYVGYNTVREFERLPRAAEELPECTACLMLTDCMIIFDNVLHTVRIVCCARQQDGVSVRKTYNRACEAITRIEQRMKQPPLRRNADKFVFDRTAIRSNMSKTDFMHMVEKAKDYIVKGDIIQVVPSQRFSVELNVQPLQLYRALRLINPSPYNFFLKFGGKLLLGSSPETMVCKRAAKIILRPIAGTRPRGADEHADRVLANELLEDVKERAEHLMLVDLGRNDLGRVASTASVQVKQFMGVERYSHVMHLVSDIEAQIRPELDCFDLIKATFPAGTLSGAPKIRAMEIIDELEPEARDAYGGGVGYFSYNGDMDMAITIRTFEIDDGRISMQAGAGIVADSDPETEYEETRHKAGALFRAIDLAANGLEI
ncbi:MAG: chorismate-binding protein [Victivallaceae bacterium]|nr:chorismate-binding protein [Victivallaceae bacterium]